VQQASASCVTTQVASDIGTQRRSRLVTLLPPASTRALGNPVQGAANPAMEGGGVRATLLGHCAGVPSEGLQVCARGATVQRRVQDGFERVSPG